jgi:hypothetical protein
MVANEERVVWRDKTLVEHRERRFELRRTRGEPDERSLLRVNDEFALAVFERQSDGADDAGVVDRERAWQFGSDGGAGNKPTSLTEKLAAWSREGK